MNSKFLVFLMIAALGNVCYHMGQKSLHTESGNPLQMPVLYYLFALILCMVLMPFFGKTDWQQMQSWAAGWRFWPVALGILLIELVFFAGLSGRRFGAMGGRGSEQCGGFAADSVKYASVSRSIFVGTDSRYRADFVRSVLTGQKIVSRSF